MSLERQHREKAGKTPGVIPDRFSHESSERFTEIVHYKF